MDVRDSNGTLLNDGADLATTSALVKPETDVVWPLTGTPIPNCPLDVYPMLRALAPDGAPGMPAPYGNPHCTHSVPPSRRSTGKAGEYMK